MKEILNDYVTFIRAFENSLKIKYNTNENPCKIVGKLFERKGTIDGFNYWFHGTGCTTEKDGVIYAYNISIFVENEIEFSIWEFSEFIRTHPSYSLLKFSPEDIENGLTKLIDDGVLAWLIIMGRVYKTYSVLIA